MLNEFSGVRIRHHVDLLESSENVTVSQGAIGLYHRRVAVKACTRLLEFQHALSVPLVNQHISVPTLFTKIGCKGIARPDRFQSRILFELGVRYDSPWISL